jgi:uracil-DNA glycosylase
MPPAHTAPATKIADNGWHAVIGAEFSKPYMQKLQNFLQQEKSSGQTIFPPEPLIYNALNTTAFGDVRVVILGQDPYHGAGQAHGLSFSVPHGVRPPPSLKNIYKELARAPGIEIPAHGDLTAWARQGVLLLNTTLTVREGAAASHAGQGWDIFTDAIIRAINDQRRHVVFMLWGSHAQKKGAFIDAQKHLILTAPHPSPLSAHRGFIGCGHFTKANDYLAAHNMGTIDWAAINN